MSSILLPLLACTGLALERFPKRGAGPRHGGNVTAPEVRRGGESTVHSNDLPAGFEDARVATLPAPTSLAFTPDGRMLASGQRGTLHLVQGGQAIPLLDLSARICTRIEQGLLGIAVDPAFAENRHIYLFYTARGPEGCVNRVSRFSFRDGVQVDGSSEAVLIDNIPSKRGNHNGGDLQFGPDGHLYVSVGDGGCDYHGPGCHGRNDASRDRHVLLGKVLRISAAGTAPHDNPFTGADSAACALTGRTEPGKVCRETFALGLRNPFRMAFDHNGAEARRLFVNDPGQDRWEEINEAIPGGDYGWNLREGRCFNRPKGKCGSPPPGLIDPVFDYSHSEPGTCGAVTGGSFVPRGVWPAPYEGSYLFADYVCGQIFRLAPAPAGRFAKIPFAGGFGAGSLVHMVFGPHSGGSALYLTSYSSGGEIRRLSYSGKPDSGPPAPSTAPH